MTARTALRQGLDLLRAGNVPAPELTAEVLLCHALHRERVFLFSHPEHELSEMEWIHYGRYLHERLNGQPTQYITRRQEFYGREFSIAPGALIPRPETEHLVEAALPLLETKLKAAKPPSPLIEAALPLLGTKLKAAKPPSPLIEAALPLPGTKPRAAKPPPESGAGFSPRGVSAPPDWIPRVQDIGTGSGILAVTLALETGIPVIATDISPAALPIARDNAARLGATCHFVQCDLGSAFAAASFDLVVSNPPYIASQALAQLAREVRDHEPLVALDGGPDGLAVYRRLIPEAARLLAPGGWLILEIGSDQGATVPALFDATWTDTQVLPDLAGHPRVVRAHRPS